MKQLDKLTLFSGKCQIHKSSLPHRKHKTGEKISLKCSSHAECREAMFLWNLRVNKKREEAATGGKKAWPAGYWCHSVKLVAMP